MLDIFKNNINRSNQLNLHSFNCSTCILLSKNILLKLTLITKIRYIKFICFTNKGVLKKESTTCKKRKKETTKYKDSLKCAHDNRE
jgi:hypothetical protein